MKKRALLSLGVLVLAAACKPDFPQRDSLVTSERVLAVRADPAEAKPGTPVTYSTLVVAPDGTRPNAAADWAFCATPTSLTENDSVSPECLKDRVRGAGGPSANVVAPTPDDACSIFGPDTPPGQTRPRDADATGGFFQPMRATVDGIVAFGFERITCDLPDAPFDVTLDFNQRYVPNANPAAPTVTAVVDGTTVAFDAVPAGKRVILRATWGAADAEHYVRYDPASVSVVDAREAMRVSWFATGGAFDSDRTGRDADDPTTFTENGWQAPTAGPEHLWVVLRDSRGGISFAAYDLDVK